MHRVDVAVVGAGFGGLAAALSLAERGARVAICETLKVPGGCASTFVKGGLRFEAGATLLSGLEEGQLLGNWIARYADLAPLQVDFENRLVEIVTPDWSLPIERRRGALLERFLAFPGAPEPALRGFFREQRSVANVLWRLLDEPSLLPPLRWSTFWKHAGRLREYAPLALRLGRPLGAVLAQYGLTGFEPLRIYLDALCQITLQCPSGPSEAVFAFCAMDYYQRGAGHVRGGIGELATLLLEACRFRGADVRVATRVSRIEGDQPSGFRVSTRRGMIRADAVIANVLPAQLATLRGGPSRLPSRVRALQARVDSGFGAAMLYAVSSASAEPSARHRQLVLEPSAPFLEGNHVFVSLGDVQQAARGAVRTLTLSTHVPLQSQQRTQPGEARAYIEGVQARMRETFTRLCPDLAAQLQHSFTASPRTFARFTGREQGAVGGVPRLAGLSNYRQLGPCAVEPGLWLVGDSVFPGQSALAAAVGGTRTAEAAARELGWIS